MEVEQDSLLVGNKPSTSTPHSRHLLRKFLIGLISTVTIVGIVIGIYVTVMMTRDDSKEINRVPTGLSKLAGTDVWTVGAWNNVVLVLPDINGLSDNAKGIATYFSNEGNFTTIIVDYFNGNISNRPAANVSLFYTTNVITELYKRGYTNIQAQGYCYGGRVGVSLSSMPDMIKTCVVAHPSSLNGNDPNLIIKPMFFELASSDNGFNMSMTTLFNTTLLSRGITAEFKIYPNTTHGFAVSNTTNPVQKQIALQDSLNWFLANKVEE